jgi:hypothetical protein
MHKDYENFQEKRTFLQMNYLKPLIEEIKQTSPSIDRLNDERKLDKFQAPITLNSLSIQCTLPFEYTQLENLSPLSYLLNYTKPSINRQQIILKLIRRIQRDTTMDIVEAKEIVFEYFNHYKTSKEIDELFRFLDLHATDTFQSKEIVLICCYAERYFLYHQNERIAFQRPLQEIIDFEFLKRKFDGLKLTNSLRQVIKTLYERDIL